MSPGCATLPVRRWLALALAVVFLVPTLATALTLGTQWRGVWYTRVQAEAILRAGARRWHDPAWRIAAQADLARSGVDFVLFEDDREIYRSTTDRPIGGGVGYPRSTQRIEVPGVRSRQWAEIYYDWRPNRDALWLIPVAGLSTLLLTLGAVGWFLGHTLVKPLAATSRAAGLVAAGNLDIMLPHSAVREVAELNAAFAAMSAELRASLHQQAALEEERRLFIGAIAHDLRTPLFALRGYLEGLEHGVATTPERRATYVRVCREKADVLERLVSDLFAFTKLEYLEQTLCRQPVELGRLLTGAVEGLRPLATAKGVVLELDFPAEACVVDGDAHLLGRAVENLVDNAVQYTPTGGSIKVRMRCPGESDRASFTVADTGPGIGPQDLPHLFDPLYRGDMARTMGAGGTGLGLSIARRILRAHGGDLVVANRMAGGAEFSGWLPCTVAAVTASQITEAGEREV